MRSLVFLTPLAFTLALPVAAAAQQPQSGQASEANQQYAAAMTTMDQAMMQATDPDPGKAWAKKMLAHHQGAVAMSQVALQHTRDPEIRRMAEQTIKEQEKSIEELQALLKKHGG